MVKDNIIKKDSNVLVIGATGRVGSHILEELDKNSEGISVRYSTTSEDKAEQWKNEGRDAVILDLDRPETFTTALKNIDRVFLLTGYTMDMLHQSKMFVDAAVEAGVEQMVHLGVFTSRKDLIPHFIWHDMIETYIEASGMKWTHIHPNVISDSALVKDKPIGETGSFSVYWGDMPQGWVFASDIAAVVAEVLRAGPEKHHGANYFLSTEVLTGPEVAKILSNASGKEIKCIVHKPEDMNSMLDDIKSTAVKAYMESARVTMEMAYQGKMQAQTVVKDDVLTVLGRPGLTMDEWARQNI